MHSKLIESDRATTRGDGHQGTRESPGDVSIGTVTADEGAGEPDTSRTAPG